MPLRLIRSRSPFKSVRGPTARRVASLFVQRPEEYTNEQATYLARWGYGMTTPPSAPA
jgi:hypothetical protein